MPGITLGSGDGGKNGIDISSCFHGAHIPVEGDR